MRPRERERPGHDEPLRPWRLFVWSVTTTIAAFVLLVAAVTAPILLIPVFVLLAVAWTQRDRWHWSRQERLTTIAILLVVFASYLIQEFTD